jgi:hypothetical protein
VKREAPIRKASGNTMTSILQNAIKSGFFVISGGNSGEIEGESEYDLKKQSQFVAGQINVSFLQRKDYGAFAALGLWKNRPSQSQSAGLRPQILSTNTLSSLNLKFSSDGWVAASKPKALGMVNAGEAIPKLRLRLPPFQAIKSNLTSY